MATAGELYRLARLLREVALAVTAEPGEVPASLGLVAITEDIAHHDHTTVGEVAARTGLAQSLVSKVVAQLRTAGVVATRADDTDRRRSRITITDAARTGVFAARGDRSITDALHDRIPGLPAERVNTVETLLDRLIAELQPTPNSPMGQSASSGRGTTRQLDGH